MSEKNLEAEKAAEREAIREEIRSIVKGEFPEGESEIGRYFDPDEIADEVVRVMGYGRSLEDGAREYFRQRQGLINELPPEIKDDVESAIHSLTRQIGEIKI